ncbi:hypothetical protein GCM10020367_55200 [Streptomyces sannanensis]|uniref:Guanylate kinase n=1 Tax=Streptomyces sannanensis TaxID=285536 RepID=A0ABP6SJF4_9ACTN
MTREASRGELGGVVLFGPPTAGKDTISVSLAGLDQRFGQLTKVKVGSGRTAGYRVATSGELAALRRAGRLVLETERYGNTYAVDRADLEAMREDGRVPLIHLGSVSHLRTFRAAVGEPWLCVLLWVPRDVCRHRSLGRGDRDTGDRLAAWDEALADVATADAAEDMFHLLIRTDQVDADKAAEIVAQAYADSPWAHTPSGELSAFLRDGSRTGG